MLCYILYCVTRQFMSIHMAFPPLLYSFRFIPITRLKEKESQQASDDCFCPLHLWNNFSTTGLFYMFMLNTRIYAHVNTHIFYIYLYAKYIKLMCWHVHRFIKAFLILSVQVIPDQWILFSQCKNETIEFFKYLTT